MCFIVTALIGSAPKDPPIKNFLKFLRMSWFSQTVVYQTWLSKRNKENQRATIVTGGL